MVHKPYIIPTVGNARKGVSLSEPFVLINAFEVPPDADDDFVPHPGHTRW
jgi:hypothetical protein